MTCEAVDDNLSDDENSMSEKILCIHVSHSSELLKTLFLSVFVSNFLSIWAPFMFTLQPLLGKKSIFWCYNDIIISHNIIIYYYL